MTTTRTWASVALVILSAAVGSHLVSAGAATPTDQNKIERAMVTFSHDLPRLNGANLTVTIVKVNYGPGVLHTSQSPLPGYRLRR